MKEFFKKLMNAENPTSSKRFVAFIALLLFSATVIVNLCGVEINNEVLYSTGGLVVGALGLTTLR